MADMKLSTKYKIVNTIFSVIFLIMLFCIGFVFGCISQNPVSYKNGYEAGWYNYMAIRNGNTLYYPSEVE